MSEAASQSRRSRRFSFTSRRHQSSQPEELHPGPPVTTIGFPIDDIPFPGYQNQQNAGSSWKRAFRRSQSVDRDAPRDQSVDRRASRRLMKRPPTSGSSRRDTSVSSEAPGKPSVIASMSSRIRNRRASVSNDDPSGFPFTSQQATNSPHSTKIDATKSLNVTQTPEHAQRHEQGYTVGQERYRVLQQQKNGTPAPKQESPPAVPTLRRVDSPFYHTAAERSAIALESPTAHDPGCHKLEVRNIADVGSQRDGSMIPASLKIGRSRILDPGTKSPGSPSLRMRETDAPEHDLPKYSPSSGDVADHKDKSGGDFSRSVFSSLGQDIFAPEPAVPKQSPAEKHFERIKSPRPSTFNDKLPHPWSHPETSPIKTRSPRPGHAKTHSSSSSSSYASSSFSRFTEPQTPISSNASTTHLETTSTSTSTTASNSNSNNEHTAKKDIPRNTMSPKLDKYLAKIFVVCCHCNHWHDVPSGLYAKMIIPERLLFSGLPEPSETRSRSSKSSRSSSEARESMRFLDHEHEQDHSRRTGRTKSFVSNTSASASASGLSANSTSISPSRSPWSSPTATVQCSWCTHEMAQSCCASWTTMVHLIERHR